jgi:uncharacterized phiE125 gp8 family phage protein
MPSYSGRYRSLIVATASGVGDRPVSVSDAKDHLRIVDFTTDDTYIGTLIDAATTWCEGFCDRTFAHKHYTVAFDDWPSLRIELPRPPVQLASVAANATVTISYVDTSGTTQTLTWSQSGSQDFRLDRDHVPALVYPLYLESWPNVRLDDKSVQITYLAGYGGAANVPAPVVHAIKMLVAFWYGHRESVLVGSISKEVEFAVTALLSPYRWRPYA